MTNEHYTLEEDRKDEFTRMSAWLESIEETQELLEFREYMEYEYEGEGGYELRREATRRLLERGIF